MCIYAFISLINMLLFHPILPVPSSGGVAVTSKCEFEQVQSLIHYLGRVSPDRSVIDTHISNHHLCQELHN